MFKILNIILLVNLLFSESKIVASDGNVDDRFGKAVSITEQWLAIGANRDDDNASNSGSVYLYKYIEDIIQEEYKITSFDGDYNDYFGKSLAIDGEWLTVSALYDDVNGEKSGSAYVYHLQNDAWSFHSKLVPYDGAPFDRFGYSVDINNDTIVVGAVYDDDYGEDSGSVYVFTFINGEWVFHSKIHSNDQDEGDFFGYSVSVKNNIIAVGSVYDDTDEYLNSGSVSIFSKNDDIWEESQKISAFDKEDYDYFGNSIDISNERIVIGSFRDDNVYQNSGSVYIYNFNNNSYEYIEKLVAFDESLNDNFGQSVSVYDNYIAIGSLDDDNGTNSGSVYIYKLEEDSIVGQIKYIGNDVNQYDEFSGSLSIYEDLLLVGSQYDDDLGDESGSAYLFIYRGCHIEDSCNYVPNLLNDDLECEYALNGYECDGSCEDTIDECEVCGGAGNNGDVNFDNQLNVLDLIIIVDYILNVNNQDINECTANLNNNSIVNITDIVLLLEIILNS